jgi:hypothetical protein
MMKTKTKGISMLIIVFICVLTMGSTVFAGNSYLNVSSGDNYSYAEKKDDNEQNFYISPTTYKGTSINGYSYSTDGRFNSGIKIFSKSKASYSYTTTYAPSGSYYKLYATCNTSGWNLVGQYCP